MQNTQPVENQKIDHEDVEPRPKANLFKWATVSTLLASLGYGSAYITGLVYHQTYLSRFNVPSDLFKGATADYFVFAYMAWIESMPDWLQTFTADYRPLGLVFLFSIFSTALGIGLAIASNTRWAKSAQLRLRKNGTLQAFGGLLLFPTLAVGSLFLIPTGLTVAAIIPALVGQNGAVRTFTRDSVEFSKDCNASEIKIRCMDLMEENKLLATGYVIQASDRYIGNIRVRLDITRDCRSFRKCVGIVGTGIFNSLPSGRLHQYTGRLGHCPCRARPASGTTLRNLSIIESEVDQLSKLSKVF